MGPCDRVILSTHAEQRVRSRHLTYEDVLAIIRHGSRRSEPGIGERGGAIWLFAKAIRGRGMIVVAEVLQRTCHVITVKPGRF